MATMQWSVPAGMSAVTPSGLVVADAADLTAVQQATAGATGARRATSSLGADPTGNLTMSMALRTTGGAVVPTNPSPNPTDPPPPPTGAWKSVRFVNGAVNSPWFAVASVNPTSTTYPGGRGPNELVLYSSAFGANTGTNEWGAEVPFDPDLVVNTVNDRQPTLNTTPTAIPAGGYVLSGHGTARDFLISNAATGYTVELSYAPPPTVTPPTPTPTPTPTGAYPAKVVSVYKMMWSVNGPNLGSISADCNEIRLAFAQGSPPALVGWGSQGQSSFLSDLAAKVAAGTRIVVSVGGAGGALQISNRTAFLAGIANIRSALGGNLHGLDWDQEIASPFNDADVVWISQQLKATYGAGFGITFATTVVNGTPYTLNAAVACSRVGALDFYGQQFYDAPVSLSAAVQRINEAIGRGIPQSQLGVGMMVGNSANYWTNAQCRANYAAIRQQFPGIQKAYLWEASRAGTAEWCADMRRING
jgi:hypothetical protein